ncbi:MAG TPA: hypothetical protein VNL39_02650 [Xanthobacteraceae bacterium]|nr:hypothetical protein [Xanthobacteraceae bacterium]
MNNGDQNGADKIFGERSPQLFVWNGRIVLRAVGMAMTIWIASVSPGMAQNTIVVPGAPAPVLAPPPPAVAPPQPPGAPPKLDTFSDRVGRCAHFGALQGLHGGARDAYVRACANN